MLKDQFIQKKKKKKKKKSTHPQAIQDVDEFVLTDLRKFSITCSPMDRQQWMGSP